MRRVLWLRRRALRAADFPPGTPLNAFFLWNEAHRRRDRRYLIAGDIHSLLSALGDSERARAICARHLALRPVILLRLGKRILVSREGLEPGDSRPESGARMAASRRLVARLSASIGAAEPTRHAALFAAFEELAAEVDLAALARPRPHLVAAACGSRPRRILVIRLSALGDFVQSLGPFEALRRHHVDDFLSLLTTAPFAAFARELGLFDEVLIDRRPRPLDGGGWLRLRRLLRAGRFDRVYDLQTSQRSSAYRRLFDRRDQPEWSGIAGGCSHPHANRDRDRQHTLEKQAEQLLMAGIAPTPLASLPPFARALPPELQGREFVLLVPGSSPHRPAKRWPAERFGKVAQALVKAGYRPVVVGTPREEPLAAAIRSLSPETLDLVGRTDLLLLATVASGARLTIANDSGVAHLAAAGGSPLVVLFSSDSDPARCAPRGREVRILAVPRLDDLAVDRVLAEATVILKRPLTAPPRGAAAAAEPVLPERS
jgi:ADP-heptose:LPS heptosyltransferase